MKGRRGDKGILVEKPAAILEGGPRDGWSYYLDDLALIQRVERQMNGRQFWYRPTDRTTVHPRTFGEVESAVWEYVPELDPFIPPPPPPPTKLELVAGAVAMCGSAGGRLPQIVNNLPPELTEGNKLSMLAKSVAPLVWWLCRQGVIEQSTVDPWYDKRYRSVRRAQRPTT